MGKVLIIKGADFSAVKVGNVIVGEDVNLTTNNYDKLSDLYITNGGLYASGLISVLYFLNAGDLIGIIAQSNLKTLFSFTKDYNPISGESAVFANGTSSRNEIAKAKANMYVVQEDCVLNILQDNFPGTATLFYKKSSGNLTEKDCFMSKAVEINNNNVWHYYTGNSSVYFPVLQGTKIKIKSNTTQKSIFALIKYVGEEGAEPVYANGETARHDLPAGEEFELTIAESCILYVMNETGYFPESITVEVV
jgi:hypothetical protein